MFLLHRQEDIEKKSTYDQDKEEWKIGGCVDENDLMDFYMSFERRNNLLIMNQSQLFEKTIDEFVLKRYYYNLSSLTSNKCNYST